MSDYIPNDGTQPYCSDLKESLYLFFEIACGLLLVQLPQDLF